MSMRKCNLCLSNNTQNCIFQYGTEIRMKCTYIGSRIELPKGDIEGNHFSIFRHRSKSFLNIFCNKNVKCKIMAIKIKEKFQLMQQNDNEINRILFPWLRCSTLFFSEEKNDLWICRATKKQQTPTTKGENQYSLIEWYWIHTITPIDSINFWFENSWAVAV